MRVISLSLIQARVQLCLRARHFGVLNHVTTYFFLTQEYFLLEQRVWYIPCHLLQR